MSLPLFCQFWFWNWIIHNSDWEFTYRASSLEAVMILSSTYNFRVAGKWLPSWLSVILFRHVVDDASSKWLDLMTFVLLKTAKWWTNYHCHGGMLKVSRTQKGDYLISAGYPSLNRGGYPASIWWTTTQGIQKWWIA